MEKQPAALLPTSATLLSLIAVTVLLSLPATGLEQDASLGNMETEAIRDHLLGKQPLVDPPDANEDGVIDVADLIRTIILNPPVNLEELVPDIDLSLSSSSVPPGGTVDLNWRITGVEDFSQHQVIIQARTPGLITTGTLETMPGIVPGNGQLLYLQSRPDPSMAYDIWSYAEKPFHADGLTTDGTAAALVYPDMAGEWLFEAYLRERRMNAAGRWVYEPVAMGTGRVFASDKPTLRLRVNRPVANTDDEVIAELITTTGSEPQNVRLDTWLTYPDGSEASLPDLSPGWDALYTGPLTNHNHLVFQGRLGEFGEGRNVLHARMYTSETQQLLAIAHAPVLVSDEVTTVSGHVTAVLDSQSQPINGFSFDLAEVRVLEINDLKMTSGVPIHADGSYTLSLPPGQYQVSAVVIDGKEFGQGRFGSILLLDGMTTSSADLDIVGLSRSEGDHVASPLKGGGGLSRPMSTTNASPNPRPRMLLLVEFEQCDEDELPTLKNKVDQEIARMTAEHPGVNIVQYEDLAEILSLYAQFENDDPEYYNPEWLSGFAEGTVTSYIMRIDVGGVGSKFVVSNTELDSSTVRAVSRNLRVADSAEEVGDVLRANLLENMPAFEHYMIENTPYPENPEVKLKFLNDQFWPGEALQVVATLSEANGPPVEGEELTIIHTKGSDFVTELDRHSGMTDANGEVAADFLMPTDLLQGQVVAVYTRRGLTWRSTPRRYSPVAVGEGGGLRIQYPYPRYQLQQGYSMFIQYGLYDDNGFLIPGAVYHIDTVGINCDVHPTSLDVGPGVTPSFTMDARDSRIGYAAVQATATVSGDPNLYVVAFPFQVVGRLAVNVNAGAATQGMSAPGLLNEVADIEGMVPVFADVSVDEDRVTAVPVTFTLEGDGQLLTEQTQTDEAGFGRTVFIPPSMRSGTVKITAQATIDDETTSDTVEFDFEPELILQAYIPEFIDEQGDCEVHVRVGRALEEGGPQWEEEATVTIDAIGGTVDTPEGQTDTEGKFTTTAHLDEGSKEIIFSVTAITDDNRTARKQLHATAEGYHQVQAKANAHSFIMGPVSETDSAISGSVNSDFAADNCVGHSTAGFGHLSARGHTSGDADLEYSPSGSPLIKMGSGISTCRDRIIINDPDLTGSQGTARLVTELTASGSAWGTWGDPRWERWSYGEASISCSLAGVLEPFASKRLTGKGWAWSGNCCLESSTGPLSRNEPFVFVYGEPISFEIELTAGGAFECHDGAASASCSGSLFWRIIPDNPNAEMVSESGTDYR